MNLNITGFVMKPKDDGSIEFILESEGANLVWAVEADQLVVLQEAVNEARQNAAVSTLDGEKVLGLMGDVQHAMLQIVDAHIAENGPGVERVREVKAAALAVLIDNTEKSVDAHGFTFDELLADIRANFMPMLALYLYEGEMN